MSHGMKRVVLVMTGLLLISAVTVAEKTKATGSAQGSPPAVESKAVESLQRMSAYLGALKEFTFEVDNMLDHVFDNGQKIQLSDHIEFSVRRPDGIAASASGDTRDERWWYHGTSATLYNRRLNEHTRIKVPATIEQMLDHLANKYGLVMPLAELLFENTYEAVIDNVLSGAYVGLHQVQGVKCHHLAFRQAAIDWQIWIEDGPKPVPRKVVITYREVPGQPQYVALLGHWNADPHLPDSTFEAKCPPDSKEVPIEEALQHRAEFVGVDAGQANR